MDRTRTNAYLSEILLGSSDKDLRYRLAKSSLEGVPLPWVEVLGLDEVLYCCEGGACKCSTSSIYLSDRQPRTDKKYGAVFCPLIAALMQVLRIDMADRDRLANLHT